jgi:hypothetical protein
MGNVALGITSEGSMFESDIQSIASSVFTTKGSHGLAAGDFVALSGSVTGSYFVIAANLTATTFQLSTTYGGSAKNDFTDAATARAFVKPSIFRRGTNLAVTIADNPLTSGATTINLTAGHGARLPTAPFVLIIEGPQAATPTERYERVLVTTKSTDALTVTRGYEGTTATAHTTGRQAWVRSLAPAATAIAALDWREGTLRGGMATGVLAAGVSPATADTVTATAPSQFVARANSLYSVTGTSTTLTVGAGNGLAVGDRFCFMAKVGGSNVRMGHTYYVTGTSGGFQFAEEKHGSTYTTNITLATDITSGVIRVFTQSGTQLFDYRTSLYPKLWGWMFDWAGGDEWARGSFDSRPLTTREHFDPLTLRGVQSLIHMLSVTDNWEPAANKHYGQAITFHKNVTGGTFTLTVNGSPTAAITWSSTFATLKSRIIAALVTAGVPSATLRVHNTNTRSDAGALTSYGVLITFTGADRGITALANSLTGSTTTTTLSPATAMVKASARAQFSARLAKLGTEIANMANDKLGTKPNVLIRLDYEFNNRKMPWTAFPDNGGVDTEQWAYDANGSERSTFWKNKWTTMSEAIKTTAGATNAKTVWCVLDSKNPSDYKGAYPTAYKPDYTGFDIYTPQAPSTATGIAAELQKRIDGMRAAVPDKPIIICEFGHKVSGAITDPIPPEPPTDPEGQVTIAAGGYSSASGEGPIYETATVSSRDAWFKAFMEKLYQRSEVYAVLYYDLEMTARGQKRNWNIDGTPSLVNAFALQSRIPKNRRQV